MSSRFKFALMLGLLSTTALTSYATTSAYSMPSKASSGTHASEAHKGRVELKSSMPKMAQVEQGWPEIPLPLSKNFVPFMVKNVLVTFDNELEVLAGIGKDLIGTMLTEDKILAINSQITSYYLAHDYLLPQINLDQDAMLSGILKLDVKAGCISNITIIGAGEQNSLFQQYADKIKNQVPAMKHYTQKYLGLMNKVPGFDVSYQLVPNIAQSTPTNSVVDLVIYTDKKKASIFAGSDNFAPDSLGKYQFSLLGEGYTPFASGDSIILNGSTTNHPDRLNDVGMGYNYILNSVGTTAQLYGAHAEDNGTKTQATSTPNGNSNNIKLSVTQQLLLQADKDLELVVGSEYHNNVQYQVNNGASQKYTVSKYTTGDIGLRYLFKDSFHGRNLMSSRFVHGLQGYFRNYIDQPANLPKTNFNKMHFDYFRDQQIGGGFSAMLHMAVIHSADDLPTSEQASFGGRDFGRGYAFATLEGTKMHAASLELRYTKDLGKYFIDEIQPYIYGDAGHVNRYYADTSVSHLESVGGGLRFKFFKNIDLGVEAAHPCSKNVTVDSSNIKSQTVFNVFINKIFEF